VIEEPRCEAERQRADPAGGESLAERETASHLRILELVGQDEPVSPSSLLDGGE
jgi:hypothetical protein